MKNKFKPFDFGRQRHQVWVNDQNQDAARLSAQKKAGASNRRAENRLKKSG